MHSFSIHILLGLVSLTASGFPAIAGTGDSTGGVRFTNLKIRETSEGALLTGSLRLPGATPMAAAHIDVTVDKEGKAVVFQSPALTFAHPRLPHHQQRRFSVKLPARTSGSAIELSYHAGVHR